MAYEVFERKVKRVMSPSVSLSKMGRIVLNKTSAELLKETGAQHVHLLWDSSSRTFAVRPVFTKGDARAYLIRYGNGSAVSGANVNAKTFLDYIGCDYEETRSFPAKWNEKEHLLEVSLPASIFNSDASNETSLPTPIRRIG